MEDKERSNIKPHHDVHVCNLFVGRCGLISKSVNNLSKRKSSEVKLESVACINCLILGAIEDSTSYLRYKLD